MKIYAIVILFGAPMALLIYQLNQIKRKINCLMKTQADLDAAIAALPAAIESAVTAAVAPVIAAIQAKAGEIDLTEEVDQLNAIAANVATKVAADLTPPATPTV